MKLLTKPLRERLIANYRSNRGGEADHPPVIRLFTPDAQATWLISEFDPEDGLCFGLCDLGMGCPELGYVSLAELETVCGALGLPVERDRHFKADRPLSAYAAEARRAGRIIA
jgi:hypothetical protein